MFLMSPDAPCGPQAGTWHRFGIVLGIVLVLGILGLATWGAFQMGLVDEKKARATALLVAKKRREKEAQLAADFGIRTEKSCYYAPVGPQEARLKTTRFGEKKITLHWPPVAVVTLATAPRSSARAYWSVRRASSSAITWKGLSG